MAPFDLQGHRGARGLAPENTLPSFELALDTGVSTRETHLHVTPHGQAVLFHDECISPRTCTPAPPSEKLIATLALAELRRFQVSTNAERARFPQQRSVVTPVAALFCQARGLGVFAIPTLGDLIDFTQA